MPEPLIRDISDTALWVAIYRAWESERPDALFRDVYARRLAGQRGAEIDKGLGRSNRHAWAYVARTWVTDQFLRHSLRQGADTVINLACGLDARPYYMDLPPTLRWFEVDLPGILDYKEEILRGEKPVCSLQSVRLDLSDATARREFFARVGGQSQRAVILSEGLLVYLARDEVAALATDLAAQPSFRAWAIDLCSPGLLKRLQRGLGKHLDAASAPLKFAPPEGPAFFSSYGWTPAEVHSMLHAAARIGRLPWFMRPLALFPERNGPQGERPWGGCVLLTR